MPRATPDRPAALRSRGLRIWSGAVLGLFVVCHFSNIALGLVSPQAMEAAAPWLGGAWHAPPGTALLLGALLVHYGLSLRALLRRRTLRMTPREAAQLGLGLLLPFLILSHVVAARIEPALRDVPTSYAEQVRALWLRNPVGGARQSVALVVAWVHGCLGFWFALRARPWFNRWSAPLFAAALLVPVLALLGFAEAGRAVAAHPWHPRIHTSPAGVPSADALWRALAVAFAAPIAAVLAARGARSWFGRHRRFRVTYPDGRSVSAPLGSTVLETSRIGGVPHVALCGGRGRCSTCRIRVTAGREHLPEPAAGERATLERSRAAPGDRLACQLRPTQNLAVEPVFAPPRRRHDPPALRTATASRERELAVLFCDLRGFTHRVEDWLPFDTVFLLNLYFAIVGEAVEAAGGHLDKFIGDGALALFGLDAPPQLACRQALAAAAGVARGLARMNAEHAAELGEPLRIAMGLHLGPAVVGDMGYGDAVGLTAVGDGINVASRLESAAKERDVEAVVSAAVLARAGREVSRWRVQSIAVRGRAAPVEAVFFAEAASLDGSAAPGARVQAESAPGRG